MRSRHPETARRRHPAFPGPGRTRTPSSDRSGRSRRSFRSRARQDRCPLDVAWCRQSQVIRPFRTLNRPSDDMRAHPAKSRWPGCHLGVGRQVEQRSGVPVPSAAREKGMPRPIASGGLRGEHHPVARRRPDRPSIDFGAERQLLGNLANPVEDPDIVVFVATVECDQFIIGEKRGDMNALAGAPATGSSRPARSTRTIVRAWFAGSTVGMKISVPFRLMSNSAVPVGSVATPSSATAADRPFQGARGRSGSHTAFQPRVDQVTALNVLRLAAADQNQLPGPRAQVERPDLREVGTPLRRNHGEEHRAGTG